MRLFLFPALLLMILFWLAYKLVPVVLDLLNHVRGAIGENSSNNHPEEPGGK